MSQCGSGGCTSPTKTVRLRQSTRTSGTQKTRTVSCGWCYTTRLYLFNLVMAVPPVARIANWLVVRAAAAVVRVQPPLPAMAGSDTGAVRTMGATPAAMRRADWVICQFCRPRGPRPCVSPFAASCCEHRHGAELDTVLFGFHLKSTAPTQK